MPRLTSQVLCSTVGFALIIGGCGREETSKAQQAAPAVKQPSSGHTAPVIALGTATAGPFTLEATRDEGKIEAGKDAPIDVRVKSTSNAPVKVTAVRFWIGNQSGQGSIKAKADIENPAEPDRWHTHAEIPDPLPADARLWVEIEPESGEKQVTSFDLKK